MSRTSAIRSTRASVLRKSLKPASTQRRAELDFYLRTLAYHTTGRANYIALTERFGLGKEILSRWLRYGDLSPWAADILLKAYNKKRDELLRKKAPRIPEVIKLADLSPSCVSDIK